MTRLHPPPTQFFPSSRNWPARAEKGVEVARRRLGYEPPLILCLACVRRTPRGTFVSSGEVPSAGRGSFWLPKLTSWLDLVSFLPPRVLPSYQILIRSARSPPACLPAASPHVSRFDLFPHCTSPFFYFWSPPPPPPSSTCIPTSPPCAIRRGPTRCYPRKRLFREGGEEEAPPTAGATISMKHIERPPPPFLPSPEPLCPPSRASKKVAVGCVGGCGCPPIRPSAQPSSHHTHHARVRRRSAYTPRRG